MQSVATPIAACPMSFHQRRGRCSSTIHEVHRVEWDERWRSVTVLRAGRGRRTPKISVCTCVRACVHVGAKRARQCSCCTPTSLCSPVIFAEAAPFLSFPLTPLVSISKQRHRSVNRPILTWQYNLPFPPSAYCAASQTWKIVITMESTSTKNMQCRALRSPNLIELFVRFSATVRLQPRLVSLSGPLDG